MPVLRTSLAKKRGVGLLLFAAILVLFFSFNRLPKLDIVGEDLDAVTAPRAQCFQGFCVEREAGTSFLSRWFVFSVTYLRLVTVGMTFAFVVAGLTEAFLFPAMSGIGFSSGGVFGRTLKGAALGPVMNLCSACIVPVSSAFYKRAGLEGSIAMVQGSATMNIPALAMVFFVFTPLLGFSRLVLAVIGALVIGPIVVMTVRKERGPSLDLPESSRSSGEEKESAWGPALTEAFREWGKTSVGYLVRMGPIMVAAGFASGLAVQWLSPETVSEYLGNDILGVAIAATFGILINVPLLFEIPLVALLLLLGMGTAPAATLLFTAAAGGPVTFWGLAKLMPKRAIATFATATWGLGAVGGLGVLGIGTFLWEDSGLRDTQSRFVSENLSVAEAAAAAGAFGDQPPIFSDVTSASGVDFTHHAPNRPNTEPFGASVVVFDFDGDGLDDIYAPDTNGPNALYRNNGDGSFTEMAAAAGVDDPLGRGIGGCAADYDNDGDQDLYLSNVGASRLFLNNGDQTFADVTAEGLDGPSGPFWGMGCAWGDYDRDGFVDLIVVRYFYEEAPALVAVEGTFTVVGGLALYHSNRDGTFNDVTHFLGDSSLEAAGKRPGEVGNVLGTGFQPGWFDYDNDGDPDLYVVNDLGPKVQGNVMWRNDGPADGGAWTFVDISQGSGTDARMQGMALAVGDYDLDGYLDFFITNIGENVLYRNSGDGLTFEDTAVQAGVAKGLLGVTERVAWGAVFFDYDNDADEDLYVVSGFLASLRQVQRKEQPNLLLRNEGDGRFADLSPVSGADDAGLGRGVAYLDFNQDGCLDLFLSNYGQRAKLLKNACDSGGAWLAIRLVGTASNRDGIGARVTLEAGGVTQIREVSAGASQMSQNTMAVHFGLGEAVQADTVTIRWPSRKVQTLTGVPANQRLTVTEPQ